MALIGVVLYTVLVGADAVVVRAVIMGGLFIIAARFMGRPTNAPAVPFLTDVAPFIAVISSWVDNQYGHPHPAVLSRLSDAGAAVLRTDELGTIKSSTDWQVV